MLAIRLDKELEKELDMLVEQRGSNRSTVVREAIVRYLEDDEDLQLAKQSLADMKNAKPLSQMRKELGLDS